MPLRVECGGCDKTYTVKDELAGKKLRCKTCGATIPIPAAETDADDEFGFQAVNEDDQDSDEDEDEAPARRPAPARRAKAKPAAKKRKARSSEPGIGLRSWAVKIAVGFFACCAVLNFVARIVRNVGGPDFRPNAAGAPALPVGAGAGQPPAGQATDLFPVAGIPLPQFPELPAPQVGPAGERNYFVTLSGGGTQTSLRLYLPPGEHPAGALPCVFVAPAGSNLLSGLPLDDLPEGNPEHLPFVRAGFAVMHYSLTGAVANRETASDAEFAAAYGRYSAASAGMLDARFALEFLLARVPQVDPARLYACGHSSGATTGLLFAEHEPRLKGCVALAPEPDLAGFHGQMLQSPGIERALPGLGQFVKRASPITHAARLNCPVLILHGTVDQIVPFARSQAFADALRQQGKNVTLEPLGADHYIVGAAMPRAVAWLQQLSGKQQ